MLNAYIALFIYIFSKKKDNLWLIGGHAGELYTDNSKVFYEYIVDKHPDIDIYWVINKNAPVFDQIKSKKVIKGSIKAYLYFYHSKVTLFSDTLNLDIAPFAFVLPCIRRIYNKKFKVYLSHGTIAFKKMPKKQGFIQEIKESIFRSYNLAIASTLLEKKAMLGYGIKSSNIEILGSARHDRLNTIESQEKMILIAPTWRGWLSHNKTLQGTEFFEQYTQLLGDPLLNTYLKKHSIHIHFYLHHMFHRFLPEFEAYENRMITILKPSARISESIMSAKMMLTDYSSICSDFYYLKKPVLFFQFDRDEYSKKVGSEIDLEKNIFGEVAYSVEDTVDKLIASINKEFQLSLLQKEGEKYFINFRDRDNCRRIYDTILKKLVGGS